MSDNVLMTELTVDGPGAPPRENGELVFSKPWESRAFGMAITLYEQGYFEWQEFQRALIAEIKAWDCEHPDQVGWSYYTHWLSALEKVLGAKDLCAGIEVDQREKEFSARPHGHDH